MTTTDDGRRSLGREEITVSTTYVPVPFHRTDGTPTLFAGFRQHWMDGADDGTVFELAAGAGLGSPYLTLSVTVPGHPTVYEYVDVRNVFSGRVAAIVAERAPKAETANMLDHLPVGPTVAQCREALAELLAQEATAPPSALGLIRKDIAEIRSMLAGLSR